MSQARPRARGAHAAPRTAWSAPRVDTGTPRHGRVLPAPLTALVLGAAGGGLALLGALGPAQSATEAATPTPPLALSAQALSAPAPLDDDRWDDRASRARRAAAADPEPAPVVTRPAAPAPPPQPTLPGCDGKAHDIAGFANGRLPAGVLCTVPDGTGERLRADAAVSFVGLAAAYQKALGEPLCLTDGYRPLSEQQQLRRTKPRFAARPGHSEHGWGLAVDLSCGVQSFRTKQHAWLVAHAAEHGWFLPDWAQRGGSRPEPWHWEFAGQQ